MHVRLTASTIYTMVPRKNLNNKTQPSRSAKRRIDADCFRRRQNYTFAMANVGQGINVTEYQYFNSQQTCYPVCVCGGGGGGGGGGFLF